MVNKSEEYRATLERQAMILEARIQRLRRDNLAEKCANALTESFKRRLMVWEMRLHKQWPVKAEAVRVNINIVDVDEEKQVLMALLEPFYETAGEEGMDDQLAFLSAAADQKLIYRGSTEWIRNNAIRFGRKYSDLISVFTDERIRSAIETGIDKGWGIQELMDEIKSLVMGPNETYRAEMIGRTEIGRAYEMSGLTLDRRMGLTLFEMVGCDADCPECGEFMDGNPHDGEEMEEFLMSVHPNHKGSSVAVVTDEWVPDLAGMALEGRRERCLIK